MEGFLIFLTIFVTLISAVVVAMLVPYRQRLLRLDPSVFKRVKVPFPLSWFFVGTGDDEQRNVRQYGVILPMFILHIVGYALAILIVALVPCLYQFAGMELDVLFVVPLAVAVFFVLVVFITEILCAKYFNAKQRETLANVRGNGEQSSATEIVEEQPADEQPTDEQPTDTDKTDTEE